MRLVSLKEGRRLIAELRGKYYFNRARHVLQGFYAVPATSHSYIIPEESAGTHTWTMDAEDVLLNAFSESTGKVTHPQFLPQITSGASLRRSS